MVYALSDFSADIRDAPSARFACEGRHTAGLSICVSRTSNARFQSHFRGLVQFC